MVDLKPGDIARVSDLRCRTYTVIVIRIRVAGRTFMHPSRQLEASRIWSYSYNLTAYVLQPDNSWKLGELYVPVDSVDFKVDESLLLHRMLYNREIQARDSLGGAGLMI